MGRSRIDSGDRRVYAVGLTKEQAQNLPEFSEDVNIDREYEERVMGVYGDQTMETAAELGTDSASMPYVAPETTMPSTETDYVERDQDIYQQKPHLFEMSERDHQSLKLYEERLVANKQRQKTGAVSIGKHVETQTQNVTVPVEKEQVVIERKTPENAGQPVSPEEADFRDREVTRMDVYEEKPEIRKEAVLREEVSVRKEIERDTVNASEQIRREELDIDSEGRPIVDKNP